MNNFPMIFLILKIFFLGGGGVGVGWGLRMGMGVGGEVVEINNCKIRMFN